MNGFATIPSLGIATEASSICHFLGEGPTWDPGRGRLLWVDILDGLVFAGRLVEGRVQVDERIQFPGSATALAVAEGGELLVAGDHRLHYRSVDGATRTGTELISGVQRRFNDGATDPGGRFVVGTKGDGHETLIRIEHDQTLTILDDDLRLSNGLDWSSDGRRMYHVDTLARRVFVREYDSDTGAVGQRDVFADFVHGYPDGLTVDADDHVWVAVWGEGCVVRLDPTGEIVARVDVPAPHTSSVVFAGPLLDTLVITTAQEDLTVAQLAQFPASGRIFTIKPGVVGLPPHSWSGFTGHSQLEGRS